MDKDTTRKASSEPIRWGKVYIFISSTFNDMHAERDYLVKQVFPRLRDWCERRKIRMMDVDLRWGVTETDATHNKNVLDVCLSRIDECRPFFVCLLGQRYGWIPEPKDISEHTLKKFPGLEETLNLGVSVTELEVLHSIITPFHAPDKIEENNYYPSENAFFFIRDGSYINSLRRKPAYLRRIYSDLEELDKEKKEYLKKKRDELLHKILNIKRSYQTYRATWDEKSRTPEIALPLKCSAMLPSNQERWRCEWMSSAGVKVAGLDVSVDKKEAKKALNFNREITNGRLADFSCESLELGEVIFNNLTNAISVRYPEHREVIEQSGLQKEIDQQEHFLIVNSECFINREGDFDKLDEYIKSDSHKLFVLASAGGMGKSTLLSNWLDTYRDKIDTIAGESVHFRFIGASDGSTTVYGLLSSILEEVKKTTNKLNSDIPANPEKLIDNFFELLEEIGNNGKTVLLIDALDQLNIGLYDLSWIPRTLPANIKMIVSFKRDLEDKETEYLYQDLLKDENVIVDEVKPFTSHIDKEKLIKAYLEQYLKELDDQHTKVLTDLPGSENPLYLKVRLSELRLFGSFANLGEEVQYDFGDNPITAFDAVLRRLENEPSFLPISPQTAVPLLFGMLAQSRQGMSINELTDLFIQEIRELRNSDEDRRKVSETIHAILRQVRQYTKRKLGRYDFFYESFRIASQLRYTKQKSSGFPVNRLQENWHSLLADYFISQGFIKNSWKGSNPRNIDESHYHLTRSLRFKELENLFCNHSYLLECCSQDLQSQYESGRSGIYGLIMKLNDSIAFMSERDTTNKHIDTLKAIRDVLLERSEIIARFPDIVSREVANYIGTVTNSDIAHKVVSLLKIDPKMDLISKSRIVPSMKQRGHIANITALASSLSGKQFASGGRDGSIAYWWLNEDKPRWLKGEHWGFVTSVNFSRDGRRVVSTGEEGKIIVWETETARNRILREPEKAWKTIPFACFCDNNTVFAVSLSNIYKIDVNTKKIIMHDKEILKGYPNIEFLHFSYSPSSNTLAIAREEGLVSIVDSEHIIKIRDIRSLKNPDVLSLSHDGQLLLVVSGQGDVVLHDVSSGKILAEESFSPFCKICCDKDNFYGYTRNHRLIKISFVRLDSSLKFITMKSLTKGGFEFLHSLTAFNNTDLIGVGRDSGTITLVNKVNGHAEKEFPNSTSLCMGQKFPNNKKISAITARGPFITGREKKGKEVLFVRPSGKVLSNLNAPHSMNISGVAALSANKGISVDNGGTIILWENNKLLKKYSFDEEFTCCAGDPKGGYAVIGTKDKKIFIINTKGEIRQVFNIKTIRFSYAFNAVAVVSNPLRIAAVTSNGSLSFTDSRGSWSCKQDSNMCTAVGISPDGRFCSSGNTNGIVRLWDCEGEGKLKHEEKIHTGEVTAIGFSSKGDFLCTGGSDKIVNVISTSNFATRTSTMLPGIAINLELEDNSSLRVIENNGYIFHLQIG